LISTKFHSLPSVVLNLDNDYEAYCFNEACAYILTKLENEETPHFEEDKKQNSLLAKMLTNQY